MDRYWMRNPTGLYLPVEIAEGVFFKSGLLVPIRLPPLLKKALYNLIHSPYEEEWQQDELTATTLRLRAGIAYEFLLRQFGLPIPGWKVPLNTDASICELIDKSCRLWIATWEMLEWLHWHQYWDLPAVELYGLLCEYVFLTPFVADRRNDKSKGATTIVNETQSQNRSLLDRSNPFTASHPETDRIIGAAVEISNQNEGFYKNLFKPVVKLRMELTTTIASEPLDTHHLGGKRELRGRGGSGASKPRRTRSNPRRNFMILKSRLSGASKPRRPRSK
jgi:hypothetical protein